MNTILMNGKIRNLIKWEAMHSDHRYDWKHILIARALLCEKIYDRLKSLSSDTDIKMVRSTVREVLSSQRPHLDCTLKMIKYPKEVSNEV